MLRVRRGQVRDGFRRYLVTAHASQGLPYTYVEFLHLFCQSLTLSGALDALLRCDRRFTLNKVHAVGAGHVRQRWSQGAGRVGQHVQNGDGNERAGEHFGGFKLFVYQIQPHKKGTEISA